ncbi:MAG: rhodanese-like domain-containing protein [Bacteroidales bacterium]|nr:rhodanese-like domain-containing protein [Bacteroidales bacterium]
MNPRITISIILLAVASVVAFLPETSNRSFELAPDELLIEIQKNKNYFSVDELADLLVNADPSVLLIDLRSEEEYKNFSLPGSLNIPFDQLLDEKWEGYLDQTNRKNIFYSNGTTLSTQAWILTTRLAYKNNYVLTGGINEWFDRIVQPVPPEMTEDKLAYENYQSRLSAKAFFYGGTAGPKKSSGPAIQVQRKKKKTAGGGCG